MENVAMVLGNCQKDIDLKKELLKLLPEECLTRPVSTLSGRHEAAVSQSSGLCLLPPISCSWTEPISTGLDEGTKQEVIRYILDRRAAVSLLVTTHQEEDALLLNGQITVYRTSASGCNCPGNMTVTAGRPAPAVPA